MDGIRITVEKSVYQHPATVPRSFHDGSSVRDEEEYDDGEDDEYLYLQPGESTRAQADNRMVGARDGLPGRRFLKEMLSKLRVKTGSGPAGRRTWAMSDGGYEPGRVEGLVAKAPTLPYPSLAPMTQSSMNNSTVASLPSSMKPLPIPNIHTKNAQHASMPPPIRKQGQIPKNYELPDVQFNVQLDKLVDLLPGADRDVLAGYLRRSGQDILAVGRYLEDERNGTIRYH